MLKLTLENIRKYLASKSIATQIEAGTHQLYVMMKYDNVEYPLFVRIYEEDALLQLLLFFPFKIKAGSEPDLARLLLRINKDIDVPGFGMDEVSSVVFYRIMIPTCQSLLEEKLIDIYLDIFPRISKVFAAPIMAVATGKTNYKEILKKLDSYEKKEE